MTHTHKLIEAKISMRARKEKNKEKREIKTLLVLDSFSFDSFFFAFQLSQVILQCSFASCK